MIFFYIGKNIEATFCLMGGGGGGGDTLDINTSRFGRLIA